MTETTATPDTGAEAIAQPSEAKEQPKASDLGSQPRTQQESIIAALKEHAPDALPPSREAEKGKAEDLKKPVPSDRTEDGRFKPRDSKADAKPEAAEAAANPAPEPAAKPAVAAPDRFNDAAKADWAKAPEAVQREVARMQDELTRGIEAYKAQVEPLKPYLEMAKQQGIEFQDALRNYVAAEKALVENPRAGVAQLIESYFPGGFKAFAAEIAGTASEADTELASLRHQNEMLRQQVSQRERLAQMQAVQATEAEAQRLIEAAMPSMPRFDELREAMGELINAGIAKGDTDQDTLLRAYEMADRLNPAPAPSTAPQAVTAQTRQPATSISGAPSTGSNPKDRPSLSQEDAVTSALRRHGLI